MQKKFYASLFLVMGVLHLMYAQNDTTSSFYQTDNKVINSMCLTRNGEAIGIGDGNSIKVFSTHSKNLIAEFKNGHRDRILSIDISKDSSLLISGGKDSLVVVWDFVKKKIIRSLNYHNCIVTSVQLSPSGKYIISGGTDNNVYLYDIEKNEIIQDFKDHKKVVTTVAFTPDEKFFASAGGDKIVNIYNLENRNLTASLVGHKNWIRDFSISEDGTKLISCGDDSRVIIWDISDKQKIKMISNEKWGFGWITSVSFNKSIHIYALGELNGNVQIAGGLINYKTKMRYPVNKVLLANEGDFLKVAVATRGNGVLLIDASAIKTKTQ